jgi:hypothetical protein
VRRSRPALHQTGWYAIVPLEWAQRACDRCPARALRVGFALWHLVGRLRTRQALYVSARDLTFYMGGSVDTARRGLLDLARAELITLTRRPRHSYLVTLPDEQTLRAWLEEQARQGAAASRPLGSPPEGPTPAEVQLELKGEGGSKSSSVEVEPPRARPDRERRRGRRQDPREAAP